MLRTAASLFLAWLCLAAVMLMLHGATTSPVDHVPAYAVVQVPD